MGLLPDEVMTGKARVVLVAGEGALVEQHRGLIGYEKDQILFRIKKGVLMLEGEEMMITTFGAFDAVVEGKVRCIRLEEDDA
ncbi:MAG: YabP/YqfC family sporulation protein [Clostridia bacterium]|nr:YabP/YqfC family sporulation protein [Clostridia bacterium]MBR6810001.1 YabP/YqfC family sporulation protein [Clostridia bacterium]